MNTQDSHAYSNHDEIWLLLPWYANGSLKAQERERVKAHLGVCLVCRKELAEQAMLARHLQHEPAVEISAKPSFDRLMARIQSEPRPTQPKPKPHWLVAGFKGWLDGMGPLPLATACAAVLLAFTLPFLALEPREPAPAFHTVADSGSLDRFAQNDLRVIFAEPVTEQERATLISAIHGRIVDGPSPSGLYTVRLAESGNSGFGLPQALAHLRANPSVVFAEPALPQPDAKDGDGS